MFPSLRWRTYSLYFPNGTLFPIVAYGLCAKVAHYIGNRVPVETQDPGLTLVDSGNSPQDHCMCDSALSMLSDDFTISSESLFGDMGSDRDLEDLLKSTTKNSQYIHFEHKRTCIHSSTGRFFKRLS